jgi:hypothetical protein
MSQTEYCVCDNTGMLWYESNNTLSVNGIIAPPAIKRELPETKPCDCQWFAANIAKINACIQFCGNHGWTYEAEYIQFCPWCGKKLDAKP